MHWKLCVSLTSNLHCLCGVVWYMTLRVKGVARAHDRYCVMSVKDVAGTHDLLCDETCARTHDCFCMVTVTGAARAHDRYYLMSVKDVAETHDLLCDETCARTHDFLYGDCCRCCKSTWPLLFDVCKGCGRDTWLTVWWDMCKDTWLFLYGDCFRCCKDNSVCRVYTKVLLPLLFDSTTEHLVDSVSDSKSGWSLDRYCLCQAVYLHTPNKAISSRPFSLYVVFSDEKRRHFVFCHCWVWVVICNTCWQFHFVHRQKYQQISGPLSSFLRVEKKKASCSAV